MLPIRVTLLHYPQAIEELRQLVRSLLEELGPAFLFVEDNPCAGHRYVIEEKLRLACDFADTDWLLTIGGTWPAPGPSSAEIMPLATESVLERSLPGVMEMLKVQALPLQPRAMLDCGLAGVRGSTFLLNLPADPDLISIYLQALSPVLDPLFQAVRGEQDSCAEEGPAQSQIELKAQEFAAFLGKKAS